MTVTDEISLRIADLVRKNGVIALNDLPMLRNTPGAAGKALNAISMLLHSELILPLQEESAQASEASIAPVNTLLAARQVGLRLDRHSATAHFV